MLETEGPENDRLIRELAELTGENPNVAVRRAVEQRLKRERHARGSRQGIARRLLELGRETAALPDVDSRSPDELCGYD
jgi:hypothetical protein